MTEPDRIIRRVRGRLHLLRFLVRLQDAAAIAFLAILLYGIAARIAGYEPATLRNLLVAAGAALAAAVVGTLIRPVRREHAASEADRVLGTEERFSTSLAVHSGRAEDPMGFLPALDDDAVSVARTCPVHLIRERMKPRLRRSTWFAAAFLLAALIAPLLPLPGSEAGAEETEAVKKEREHVAEQARRLERQARRMEQLAAKNKQEELRKLAERIRTAAARMAGEKPRAAKAMSELAKLEQEARKSARRFAGMKAPRVGESPTSQDKLLQDLAKAVEQLEKADPAETRRMLSQLMDKLRKGNLQDLDPKEVDEALKSLKALQQAAAGLEGLGMDAEEISKFLEGLGGSEELQRLAEAMQKLREAMEKAGLDPTAGMTEEEMQKLLEEMRNYRLPELSEEQIQEMIRAMEELRKLIESGQEIRFCKGCMGQGMGLGLGLGQGRGVPIGLGRGPGMPGAPGQGGRSLGESDGSSGSGMGGPGQGRGGVAPVAEDPKPLAPDQAPGMINPDGEAQIFRTVRRVPDPNEDPAEYEALQRAASREAEEAIKRGEIPREYRGYIRRYFDESEDD